MQFPIKVIISCKMWTVLTSWEDLVCEHICTNPHASLNCQGDMGGWRNQKQLLATEHKICWKLFTIKLS